VLTSTTPELLVIAGDTAASLAFALAASKLGVPIVRVGGGLRCGDFSLGEELNRILADRLADIVFTDSPEATDALHGEGIAVDRVREVGSTTVDLLHRWAHQARRRAVWKDLGVEPYGFVLITLHRAENVGNDERVARFTEAVARLGERLPVVLPLHPATRAALTPMGDLGRLESAGVRVVDPLGYLDFLSLEQAAGAVVTDSAGVQEETSALGVRCHTLRRSTERVATLVRGTNVLLGDDPEELRSVRIGAPVDRQLPPSRGWDGRAAERIANELGRRLALQPQEEN
jgi:UDP-N-acetylglucosamine 2-epimerase (non-hydrolysing)